MDAQGRKARREARRPSRAVLAVVALACAGTASGCGYRFGAASGELPGKARSLHVPLFSNRTTEPGVEAVFTEALRGELARAGLEGGEAADAVVRGEVTEVVGGPAILLSSVVDKQTGALQYGQVASYRAQATAVLRVMRGPELLREIRVSGGEDYLPCARGSRSASDECVLETEANRRIALRRLAGSLMRQAFESLLTGF